MDFVFQKELFKLVAMSGVPSSGFYIIINIHIKMMLSA